MDKSHLDTIARLIRMCAKDVITTLTDRDDEEAIYEEINHDLSTALALVNKARIALSPPDVLEIADDHAEGT